MDGRFRKNIKIGQLVNIVLKKDQRTGTLTEGKLGVSRVIALGGEDEQGVMARAADHPRADFLPPQMQALLGGGKD